MANESTPSDVVAARVREVRTRHGLTTAQLAARCAALGAPGLTAQALYKLEGQRDPAKRRPRPVTVDELLVLALALDVAPVHLLVPTGYDEDYRITGAVSTRAASARAWIRGVLQLQLPGQDARVYYSEVPEGEFYTPAHWSGDGEVMISAVQQGPPRRREEDSDGEHQETS
jgi:transcriptional regulator with XRE-family HTH domain